MPDQRNYGMSIAAMSTFVASPMNRSGVTPGDMQPVVDRLAASNGVLQ